MFARTYGTSLSLDQRHLEERSTGNIYCASQSRGCGERDAVEINIQRRVGFVFDM